MGKGDTLNRVNKNERSAQVLYRRVLGKSVESWRECG